jgi:hypothetical protein
MTKATIVGFEEGGLAMKISEKAVTTSTQTDPTELTELRLTASTELRLRDELSKNDENERIREPVSSERESVELTESIKSAESSDNELAESRTELARRPRESELAESRQSEHDESSDGELAEMRTELTEARALREMKEGNEVGNDVPTVIRVGAMPRPGEPGAVGNDVTKFFATMEH